MSALCRHCNGELSAGRADGFCCNGCAGAFALIGGLGLGDWYRRRGQEQIFRPIDVGDAETVTLDPARYVVTKPDGTAALDLLIEGMHCAACVWLIEQALARQPGVVAARLNMTTRRLHVEWQPDRVTASTLVDTVTRLGYRATPFDPCRLGDSARREEKELLRCLAVAGFAAANIMLMSVAVWSGHAGSMGEATRGVFHFVSALIAIPTVAYAGRPFFRSAAVALKARRLNMDVPISLGVTLATLMSLYQTLIGGQHAYFDAAVSLLFFLLIGRYLDRLARARAHGAAEHLVALQASAVRRVLPDGRREAIPASEVAVGDRVAVAVGERIGVDGTVAVGRSDIDTGLVTGESLPQTAGPGTQVFAGTLNLSGPLEITVSAAAGGTLLAEIAQLMEAAEQGRSGHVRLADRVARAYAPVVHVLGLSTFLLWLALGAGWEQALMNAIAVLIITCPCALALAVPAVQVVASGRLFRAGVLLKSADALERLANVNTVLFDKTGTLTVGRPQLRIGEGYNADDLMLASAIAANSRHVLARALANSGAAAPLPADQVREIPGDGLVAQTATGEVRLGRAAFVGAPTSEINEGPEVWLRHPDGRLARFQFVDPVRPDAAATVAGLSKGGLTVGLLSGDRPDVVEAIARRVGIADWRGGVSPSAKVAAIADRQAQGARVLMVGDGLNDAPALAAATVSMSPSSGADITQTAADLVFQGDRLAGVALARQVALRSRRLAWQNIAVALGYNALAVPLAVAGQVTPLVAAIAMSSSSLVVVLNALRLRGEANERSGLSDSGGARAGRIGAGGVLVGAQERTV